MNPVFLLIFGALAQEVRPPVVTPLERVDWPVVVRADLGAGAEAWIVERHDPPPPPPRPAPRGGELPLVCLQVVLLRDPATEDPLTSLSLDVAAWLARGGIAQADRLGGVLDAGGDTWGSWLSLEVPSDHFVDGLDLALDRALDARLPRVDVRSGIQSWRRTWRTAPVNVGILSHYADQRLSGIEPPGSDATRRLSVRGIRTAGRELAREGHLVILVAGDVDPTRTKTLLEERLQGEVRRGTPVAAPARDSPAVLLVDTGDRQVSVEVSLPAPLPSEPGWGAALLLAQAAEPALYRAFREDRSLSYDPRATLDVRSGVARLRLQASVPAGRTGEAVDALRGVVDGLRSVSPDDLVRARSGFLLDGATELSRLDTTVRRLRTLAVTGPSAETWAGLLDGSALPDLGTVRETGARMGDLGQATWVVLGDRDMVEPLLEAVDLVPTTIWSTGRVLEGR